MATNYKTAIIIAGPTAVGKTAVAIEVAKYFDTQIISADSRQCYKEMNIGVARPSADELKQVPHHFIASHSIHEKVNAVTFESYALEKAAQIFRDKDVVVITGGTGLYIQAFAQGLDEIPDVPDEVREKLNRQYEANGLEWLQQQVAASDPAFFASGENKNPHRLLRALEVIKATGNSILYYRNQTKAKRPFNTLKLALNLPKETLHQRINLRVDAMMKEGLLQEVKYLLPYKEVNALQTVGYKELFDYIEGHYSLTEAVEKIKIHTRQYAKRQLTWFKKDAQYQWFEPDASQIIDSIKTQL